MAEGVNESAQGKDLSLISLALEGIEESGALRLEVVVRDVGLRCHAGHARDVLDMPLDAVGETSSRNQQSLR